MKYRIVSVLKKQYRDCDMVFQIFSQLTPVVEGELEARVENFLKMTKYSNDIAEDIINEVRAFTELILQVPQKAYFPMFEVDLREAKESLLSWVEEYST